VKERGQSMLSRRKALLKYENYLRQTNQSECYLNTIKVLFKYLNNNHLILTYLTKEQFLNFLEGYAIETKNAFIKAVKSYCDYFGIANKDLTEMDTIRPDVKIPKEYPSLKEIEDKVVPFLKSDEKAILHFLTATGLRKNEFEKLTKNDIDLDNLRARILYGKGRRQRYVNYSREVARELRLLINSNPQEYGLGYSIGKLRGLCQRASRGLQQRITPHSLRHIFALSAYEKGLDIASISRQLGHSSIKTTMIYLGITERETAEKYHRIMG